MNEGVVEKIRAAGGEVYAITSEPERAVTSTLLSSESARVFWSSRSTPLE